jgi:hypothetical protein
MSVDTDHTSEKEAERAIKKQKRATTPKMMCGTVFLLALSNCHSLNARDDD